MNTLKTILLALVIIFSSTAMGGIENIDSTVKKQLSQSVSKLLVKPKFKIEKELYVSAQITINQNNEIVVLSINTTNSTIKEFVLNRLNYVKLDFKVDTSKFKVYTVPMRFIAG